MDVLHMQLVLHLIKTKLHFLTSTWRKAVSVYCSLLSSKVRAYYRCRMRWCPSSVLHLLRCVRLCTRRGRNRLPLWIREMWAYVSVLVQSLYFNSLTDSDVVFDSVFEPVFWTVDYVTRWFGTVSVCMCAFISYREFLSVFLWRQLSIGVPLSFSDRCLFVWWWYWPAPSWGLPTWSCCLWSSPHTPLHGLLGMFVMDTGTSSWLLSITTRPPRLPLATPLQ